MPSLQDFLLQQEFIKVKLHTTVTNHFECIAFINNKKGRFILDTGASNSCIDFNDVAFFKLEVTDSEIKAAGAGASNMKTQVSTGNKITIGSWKYENLELVVFDLSHVNTALIAHHAKPVAGIIGADILKKGKAIIDYDKKYLYLKKL